MKRDTDLIEIHHGLPTPYVQQAAELYYHAFHQKFDPIMRSQKHAIAILAQSFDPTMAFVAVHAGQLVGIAGVQYGGRHFVNFTPAVFVAHFGRLRGWLKLVLFAV